MTTASVSVLKAKLSEYLGRVKRGAEVCVTDRGRPVAKLVPVWNGDEAVDEETAELVKAGVILPGRELPRRLVRPPKYHDPGGAVLKALLDEREEEYRS